MPQASLIEQELMEISKTTEKRLNQIQFWELQLFLRVGPGTPLASLLLDTAILKMDIRVKKLKQIS